MILHPLFAAWSTFLVLLDERRPSGAPSLLRYNSAFWNEHQFLRIPGLDDHLVLVYERRPDEGAAALDYLNGTRQRWAARAAQIELDARRLERCASVEDIAANAARAFATPDEPGDFQRTFERIAQDVASALKHDSSYNRRLALDKAHERLDPLIRELTVSKDRLAARFRTIARAWSDILATRIEELTQEVEASQEIENPYVIGVPLTEELAIFTGRADVGAEIEQALRDKLHPPLLLYGQRRMGKTSLLQNLGRLLRSDVVPLYVDLEGPAMKAPDHAGFLYNVARAAVTSAERFRSVALPRLGREALAADPFTAFDEWLDDVERALGTRTALLLVDEMEKLGTQDGAAAFDERPILEMLRNLIQHRRRFKVLLAGSHGFDELVRWSSYLINVRTLHLGNLKEDEARKLVERPVPGFPLRYEPDACDRVVALTRGHPFLVQLLCAEIVAHKNAQPPAERRLARLADVEASVRPALGHGEMYFGDLEHNQAGLEGAALLRRLAADGEGATMTEDALAAGAQGDVPAVLRRLVRREILERAEGGVRFRIELVRRWFEPGTAPET